MMVMALGMILLVAAQTAPAPTPPAKPAEKLVCKRFNETGSLVKSRRECKPEAQWQRERENIRQQQAVSSGCRIAGTC